MSNEHDGIAVCVWVCDCPICGIMETVLDITEDVSWLSWYCRKHRENAGPGHEGVFVHRSVRTKEQMGV